MNIRGALINDSPTYISSEEEGGGEGYTGKACLICSGKYVASYAIFILDFDGVGGDKFNTRWPTLRFENLGRMSFLVLDSFLYMFDAVADYVSRSGGKWMYKYDLRPHVRGVSSETAGLLIDDLNTLQGCKGPDMNHPKRNPRAIQTLDGTRILVYSQVVSYYTYEGEEPESTDVDFELYDTRTSQWTQLPQLLILLTPYADDLDVFSLYDRESRSWIKHSSDKIQDLYYSFEEESYYVQSMGGGSFINSNTFLVGIPAGVMFMLNIDQPGDGWNVYKDEYINIGPSWPYGFGYRILDNLVVTPFTVSNKVGSHRFRLSKPEVTEPGSYQVSILDYVENQECVACIMSGDVDEWKDGIPYIMCDLFKLHLPSNVRDEMPDPPTRLASFKYNLNYKTEYFYIENAYRLPHG